jgi:hypothetical protein
MTKTDKHKKAMLEALEKALGIVTSACKIVGISRETHYKWYREDARYKQQVDELGDVTLDFAESQLHHKIKDGDTTAIIFFLKTKGKKRGYIERMDIGNPADESFKVLVENVIPEDVFGNVHDEGDGA